MYKEQILQLALKLYDYGFEDVQVCDTGVEITIPKGASKKERRNISTLFRQAIKEVLNSKEKVDFS